MIPPLDNDTVWRVTGDYFPVMYFSYQLYDQVRWAFFEFILGVNKIDCGFALTGSIDVGLGPTDLDQPTSPHKKPTHTQANEQMADTAWMDRKIAPGWGKNPFQEVIPPQQAGGYQIHFTRTGALSFCFGGS